MELQGKIIAALQKRGGTTQKGTDWEAQSYVIETQGNHPRRMCFDVFGADRIERLAIQEGETLTVLFDIDARESNGRWWNTVKAWDVRRTPQQAPLQAPQPQLQTPAHGYELGLPF